jgi:ferritin-like metal-binding protein YciE
MPMDSSFHEAFLDELRDLYNAEKQITKALPKMAKAASAAPLADAFETHLRETNEQIRRLEQIFKDLDESSGKKKCKGIEGILDEGKDMMSEDVDEATMDASLIAAAQRVEHYEIAAYGTVVAWAKAMGHDQAARLLQKTLDEEKATDEKLTSLADGGINDIAAGGTGEKQVAAVSNRGSRAKRSTKAGAAR